MSFPDHHEQMFRLLFERSGDAIFLYDPRQKVFTDCNQAAVELMRSPDKQRLLMTHPAELSAPTQPDGKDAWGKAAAMHHEVLRRGNHSFEWMARRMDGSPILLDVMLTAIQTGEKPLVATVCRDISDRLRNLEILRQRVLYRISESAHLAKEPEDLYPRIHEAVAELMPARNFYLLLPEPGSQKHAFAYHVDEMDARPAPYVVDRGMNGYVLRTGLPLLARRSEMEKKRPPGVTEDESTWYLAFGHVAAVWLGIPLTIGNKTIGVMAIQDYQDEHAYGEEEKRLLTFVAEQITQAIERKRTQQALRDSELKHRTLFELSSQGVMLQDDKAFFDVNPAAVRMLGYTSEKELIGHHPAEFAPPLQPDGQTSSAAAERHIADCFRQGSTRFEWLTIGANGRRIMLDVLLTAIDLGGRRMIQAMVNDITERKRREQIERTIYRISEAVNTVDDLESLYVEIHAAVARMIGARNFYIALHEPETGLHHFVYHRDEKDPPPPPRHLGRGLTGYVFRTGKPLLVTREQMLNPPKPSEWQVEHGSVSAVWLGVPLVIRGQTIGVMVVQDFNNPDAYGEEQQRLLTFVAEQTALAIERKRSESRLRESAARLSESQARFSTAFRTSPALMAILDLTNGQFVEANDAFVQWLGVSHPMMVGRTSLDLGLWPNPAEREQVWSELRAKRSLRDREIQLCNRHGSCCTMLLSMDIIQVQEKEHILVVLLDITQRKQAEEELRRMLAREQELGLLRSNFVSMVSHEFRTPLGVIQSSAEILSDYFPRLSPEQRQEHLSSIVKSTGRMAGMMEEVLLIGQLDSGRLEFKPGALDLGAFVRHLVDELHSATHRRCPIEPTLHQIPPSVEADESLLRHILTNLITNAVKYSRGGEPVLLELRCDADELKIQVKDHGIGIPEPDLEWIFQAFHRGQNVGDRPGTGLGLVIVKRAVDLHRGTIHIQSAVGEGTHVTVNLPISTSVVSQTE